LRDEVCFDRIKGRIDDDYIFAGYNLGSAFIEDLINEYLAVVGSVIVRFTHYMIENVL
jgi:acyl-coenzyme A synthetase/AMP-(fatty) acid ligase